MRTQVLVVVLVAAGVLCAADRAPAQYFFSSGGDPFRSDIGDVLPGAHYRQFGQAVAQAQNDAMQSKIRNILSVQAQIRTDSIYNQREMEQDWCFRQQSQQLAQRRFMAQAYHIRAIPRRPGQPGANHVTGRNVIQWPPLLQESCFATERARIETPYRRTPSKLSTPTPVDYRNMVRAVDDIKAVLDWRLRKGVNTADYQVAVAFLNELGAEAVARAETTGSANPVFSARTPQTVR